MIDNLNLIKPLLNFDDEDDFYMLYVFKRKKDQSTDKANHQSVRTIRSYCIKSVEQLVERYDEIKLLCEVFKARAYMHIQKQSHKDVSLDMLVMLAERIKCGQHQQQGLFDTVVGQMKTHEKRWVVDIDTKDTETIWGIRDTINNCRPVGIKIHRSIPTKNGYHLITERFDMQEFKKQHPDIDIQKKNPTLLYYPSSLDTSWVVELDKKYKDLDSIKLDADLTEQMNKLLLSKIGNQPSKPREW